MDHPTGTEELRGIVAALRADRDVSNSEFDALFPAEMRARSVSYWTPVRVATIAAHWLEINGATRVLDVGSGAGKFCSIGATVTDAVFHGVERRAHLVEVAETLARRLGVAERTAFVVGDLDAVAFGDYDALYLYNPFYEGFNGPGSWFDETVEIGPAQARADIERIEDMLASLEVGVQLVTYHGYGGRVPDSFRLVQSTAFGGGRLLCWQKRRTRGTGQYFAENDWA